MISSRATGQVREYIYQLEAHLSDVQKQAARLIRKQDALATTLNDFGASMIALGAMLPPSPSNVNSAVHLPSACCQVSSALATPCNGLQSARLLHCSTQSTRTYVYRSWQRRNGSCRPDHAAVCTCCLQ